MKKAKLMLALSAALLLVGCNDKDNADTGKTSSTDSTPTTQQCVQSNVSVSQADFGEENDPISVADAIKMLEKVDECKTGNVYTNYKFYVYGLCVSNTAADTSHNDIKFTNLVDTEDESKKLTVMYAVLDDSVSSYTDENSLKDCLVAVSGYGMWYAKNGSYTAELTKKNNSDKATIYYVDGGEEEDAENTSTMPAFIAIYKAVFGTTDDPVLDDDYESKVSAIRTFPTMYDQLFVGSTEEEKALEVVDWVVDHLPVAYSTLEHNWGYSDLYDDGDYYGCKDYKNSDSSVYVSIYSYYYEDEEDSSYDGWYFYFEVMTAEQYAATIA